MHKFLFFDYMLLESIRNCKRKFFPPEKHALNPLLKPEYPHESSCIQLYGSVIRSKDTGLYRMWYSAYDKEGYCTLCLATSENGTEWNKPSLNVVPGTNIVLDESARVHGPSIIHDEEEPREDWRYKLIMYPDYNLKKGIWAYHSADGIHWIKANEGLPVMKEYSDCHVGLVRDPKTKLYLATLRENISRRIWLATSENFIDWSKPCLIFEPTLEDVAGMEFYGMQISPYGPYFLGVLNRFFTNPEEKSWRKMHGNMDAALAFSRGLNCWKMVERTQALISNGNKGEWDGGMIYPASAPVYNKGEVQYFYSGAVTKHGEVSASTQRCIGLASVPIDRWVGLSADSTCGEVVTKIFKIQGEGLRVNARIAAGGMLQVGFADASWQDMPGFSSADCIRLSGDCFDAEVQWGNSPDWTTLLNKNIRLKITMQNATLFALYLPNGSESGSEGDFLEFTGTGFDSSDENAAMVEI